MVEEEEEEKRRRCAAMVENERRKVGDKIDFFFIKKIFGARH